MNCFKAYVINSNIMKKKDWKELLKTAWIFRYLFLLIILLVILLFGGYVGL